MIASTRTITWAEWIWFVVVILLFTTMGLAACGGDDDDSTPPLPGSEAGGGETDGWLPTITDPLTGQSFRCYVIYRDGYKAGGPAMWCYPIDL